MKEHLTNEAKLMYLMSLLDDQHHPDYLAADFQEGEARFLRELDEHRRSNASIDGVLFLTDRQAGWLRRIYSKVCNQVETARNWRPQR